MRTDDGLRVNGVQDDRWSVALDLLEGGEAPVYVDDTIRLDKATVGLNVEIVTSTMKDGPAAQAEVDAGLRLLVTLTNEHPKLQRMAEDGMTVEYTVDYGMGRSLVGSVSPDGTLSRYA